MKKNMNKKGFTLAETLITLVIIGVIAAITVPALITKYQKEQTVTRLKKVYSTFAQATQKAIADNGPMNTWEFDNGQTFFSKYLKPYMSVLRDCDINTPDSCPFNYSYLNSGSERYSYSNQKKFYLSDGTLVALEVTDKSGQKYVRVYIDINGSKKPNVYGKDIFRFNYFIKMTSTPHYNHIGKIMPNGYEYSLEDNLSNRQDGCSKKSTQRAGSNCAAVIMQSAWTITNDYPW